MTEAGRILILWLLCKDRFLIFTTQSRPRHCKMCLWLLSLLEILTVGFSLHRGRLSFCILASSGATVKNKKCSPTSLPGLVSWELSLKENYIYPKTSEDTIQ